MLNLIEIRSVPVASKTKTTEARTSQFLQIIRETQRQWTSTGILIHSTNVRPYTPI
jgi:hypothetical protein